MRNFFHFVPSLDYFWSPMLSLASSIFGLSFHVAGSKMLVEISWLMKCGFYPDLHDRGWDLMPFVEKCVFMCVCVCVYV